MMGLVFATVPKESTPVCFANTTVSSPFVSQKSTSFVATGGGGGGTGGRGPPPEGVDFLQQPRKSRKKQASKTGANIFFMNMFIVDLKWKNQPIDSMNI